jgi:hypothetical protein
LTGSWLTVARAGYAVLAQSLYFPVAIADSTPVEESKTEAEGTMKTTSALADPEPQAWSTLVSIEAEAFLASVNRQASRDRNATAIADLEASWKLS